MNNPKRDHYLPGLRNRSDLIEPCNGCAYNRFEDIEPPCRDCVHNEARIDWPLVLLAALCAVCLGAGLSVAL